MSREKPAFRSKLSYVLDAYLDICFAKHTDITIPRDIRVMKSFDDFLYEINYDGKEITDDMITDWTSQLSSKLSPLVVKQYRQKISKMLRLAYKSFGLQSSYIVLPKKKVLVKPVFQSSLGYVFDAYADKCLAEHAPSTIESDFATLKSLDDYLCRIGYHDGEITVEILEGWVAQLLEKLAPASVALHERKTRRILHFAEAFGVSSQMIDSIKVPDDYVPYIFTQEQLFKLCVAADNITFKPVSIYPWIQAEIPMLTRIYMACGTRTSETLALRMRDVDLEQSVFTMRTTKGNIERFVPFTDELREILKMYCHSMGIVGQPESYLFPGLDRNEILPGYMYRNAFNKMVQELDISFKREKEHQRAICPYCMRHTFACMAVLHLQKQGVIVDNIYPYLSSYMGHKDLYSTEKYLKFSEPLMNSSLEGYEEKMKSVYSGRAFNREEVW